MFNYIFICDDSMKYITVYIPLVFVTIQRITFNARCAFYGSSSVDKLGKRSAEVVRVQKPAGIVRSLQRLGYGLYGPRFEYRRRERCILLCKTLMSSLGLSQRPERLEEELFPGGKSFGT
jgi:hypothetical protein